MRRAPEMNGSRTLVIFRKELREIRNSRILLVFVITPLVAIALLLRDVLITTPLDQITAQATLFVSFFGLLLPITMSGMLSVDSFVGERNRRTIEPLLASPVTERELFVGKALAAFLPSMMITYVFLLPLIAAFAVVAPSTLAISFSSPSLLRLTWQIPVLALLVTTTSTIVSCRVTDTRIALQVSNYIFLGIFFLFGFGELSLFANAFFALVIATTIVSVIDVLLLVFSYRYFTREELMRRT